MPEAARICLIGAGPVGSLLAAALAENSIQFEWVVRNAERFEALRRGFQLRLTDYSHRIEPAQYQLARQPSGKATHRIVAVRAQQVETVLREAQPGSAERTLVVANGLQQGPFQLGLLYGGALLHTGGIEAGSVNKLVIGNLNCGPGGEFFAERLRAKWLECSVKEPIAARMWHKLALNCVINPLTALLGCSNGQLLPFIPSPLVNQLLVELDSVARSQLRESWTYDPRLLADEVRGLLLLTHGNRSSMLRDVEAGRETEIGMLNGAVLKLGSEAGLPCPVNAALEAAIIALTNRARL